MKYSETQIETARKNYNELLKYRTVEVYLMRCMSMRQAQTLCDLHNNSVAKILSGDKEEIKYWKLWYLNEAFKNDKKLNEKKAKLSANKEASSDVLAPIKQAKRIGEFGKWLNTPGNQFRTEHFNKKYTIQSVNAFLAI